MSEKNIKVPAGMLAAAEKSMAWPHADPRLRAALEDALGWLSENPIAPTYAQIDALMDEYVGQAKEPNSNRYLIVEWQRRMFLEPEPAVPEEIKDLLAGSAYTPMTGMVNLNPEWDKRIIEAYRRGQRSVTPNPNGIVEAVEGEGASKADWIIEEAGVLLKDGMIFARMYEQCYPGAATNEDISRMHRVWGYLRDNVKTVTKTEPKVVEQPRESVPFEDVQAQPFFAEVHRPACMADNPSESEKKEGIREYRVCVRASEYDRLLTAYLQLARK
jgi:hypothetical protein